ncbi:hypothetical protein [Pyrococcus abyssi]|uniref:Uncharacterized protein n=1 Tax=Pyrococcus abyssi (strain GE5 / Orsay) TaxID=272844 RepID=G8ZHU0_PYRAB|nr:hypothetical protein [Pyrococcus abyssi]CCE69683.1 TPA: hypothetical protein PAB0207.1n [Pyrococcus abyssi GE5]
MKAKDVLKLIDEAEANIRIALVSFSTRINESPYTAFEFTQTSLELEDLLMELSKLREKFKEMDPEEDVDVPEELIAWLKSLINFKAHLF